MHGRPREYKNKLKSDPKAQEAYKKKVDAIRNGTALVLEHRKQRKYDPAVLNASAKLLKVVPEIYTLWNYRREALEAAFAAGGEEAQRASEGELALTQSCLMENPKSYSTWHHRKWVVAQGLAPLERELQLISRALDEDQRNFHAWNYRQFICRRMGRSAQDELQYVEEKILQNFSNYSAWHFRTILLHQMYCGGAGSDSVAGQAALPEVGALTRGSASVASAADGAATRGSASQRTPIPHDVLDQEYDMVHQAFATDSRDESPWMYYRWLVGNTLAHLGNQHQPAEAEAAKAQADTSADAAAEAEAVRGRVAAVLEREACRLLEDHLAADPDAKWPLLTLARLREAQARLGLGGSVEDCEALLGEARSLYGRLMELDPLRRGFYQDALEGRAFVVVQALGTV
ncbi:hypothetical protein PLESTB_000743300 [Pleodorina starrii]|uniref:Geranylgeranyl transferase type-2 subunit alpha n=1 Tax=Pleodorina starrii TaxID=330485 RepID=A0A9W6BKA5_9CHLO|nr:hypothetical protein PLESTM_000181400 [Pleodorina starrii]GLC53423.1 hypothetical protein PLESTB_000743300 [Pleodorina starrii]GLC69748.1 hypothetical protein PLESTF_000875500 [Pleodorina starrii]